MRVSQFYAEQILKGDSSQNIHLGNRLKWYENIGFWPPSSYPSYLGYTNNLEVHRKVLGCRWCVTQSTDASYLC